MNDPYQTRQFFDMKQSELRQIIKEEIRKILNEEGTVIWSPVEMTEIYGLMKSKGYSPKINEGNLLNIKTIEIAVPGAGMMKISRDGNIYADYNIGGDAKTIDELLSKIEELATELKKYN
jgi:hypothetical protein